MGQSELITEAAAKVGSLSKLARMLDQNEGSMRDARQEKRGLPIYACVALAKILEIEPMTVIAASELITTKKEERRALFLPFLQKTNNATTYIL